MNKTITMKKKNIEKIGGFSVLVFGLIFVLLPILAPGTAQAQEEGYVDYGGGDNYFVNQNPVYPDIPTVADQGYVDYGGGDNLPQDQGYVDYGGGDNSPAEIAVETPSQSTYERTYDSTEWSFGLGSGYSTGIAYGYGSTYGYSTPSYTYTTPVYTYPTYTYQPQPYIPTSGPACTLTVSDNSIDDNDEITIRWTTTGATSVSLNGGIGSVAQSGSRVVSPNNTITYSLVASGQGGTVWCTETVTVDEVDTPNNDNAQCDSFTVSDDEVNDGDRVTLTWRTTGANDVRINNGVGEVANDGNVRVTIDEDTTFTLTARDGNDTDTCRVTVDVRNGRRTTNTQIPRCTLTISDRTVTRGQRVTLSWENLRTDRLVIRDGFGATIADSREDRKLKEDRDSIVISPTRSTDYTLTVYNDTERRTCTVSAVVGGIQATSVRGQDTIALSEVPYTGFEAGTLLTAIFYGAIILWGVVIAYFLVRRKETEEVEHTVVFATGVATHEVSAPEAVTIPTNLPTEEVVSESEDTLAPLEAYAHTQGVLISSEALRFIESEGNGDSLALLERVITLAKGRFPKENDWIVINKERVISLLA